MSEKPQQSRTVAEQMAIARAARKPGNFARDPKKMRAAALKRWDSAKNLSSQVVTEKSVAG